MAQRLSWLQIRLQGGSSYKFFVDFSRKKVILCFLLPPRNFFCNQNLTLTRARGLPLFFEFVKKRFVTSFLPFKTVNCLNLHQINHGPACRIHNCGMGSLGFSYLEQLLIPCEVGFRYHVAMLQQSSIHLLSLFL